MFALPNWPSRKIAVRKIKFAEILFTNLRNQLINYKEDRRYA